MKMYGRRPLVSCQCLQKKYTTIIVKIMPLQTSRYSQTSPCQITSVTPRKFLLDTPKYFREVILRIKKLVKSLNSLHIHNMKPS